MMPICVMSVRLFFHMCIRIYMEVIILGANTLYSVFSAWPKALLPKQVLVHSVCYFAPYVYLALHLWTRMPETVVDQC